MVCRRTRFNAWMLAALLVAGFVAVPLAHAAEHLARPDAPAASTVEAYCDLCHQPFVALPAEAPAALATARVEAAPEERATAAAFRAVFTLRLRGPPATA